MNKIDIVQLLKEGNTIRIFPQGSSMMPFIYPGRDEVVISPDLHNLKQFDIILFRSRQTGLLTLHRIMEIKDGYYLVSGDNQFVCEKVENEQVIGVVKEIIRKGQSIKSNNIIYRALSNLYSNNKKTIASLRKIIKK